MSHEGHCLSGHVADQTLAVDCDDCGIMLAYCWGDNNHIPESLWNRACIGDNELVPCKLNRDDYCAVCGEKC